MSPRLAVLVSGTGRSLANLAERTRNGSLDATIALVLANRTGIQALDRASQLEIDHCVVDPDRELDPEAFSKAIFTHIENAKVDLVILAGFLRLLPLPKSWIGRVINIHPSLLPAFGGKGFYGERVHRAVLDRGCEFSGCTVHYVTDEYDAGPILHQRIVPVLPGDNPKTLAARVFEAEQEALPEAIARHFAD